jgi:tyrosyl-tRNA synthetase
MDSTELLTRAVSEVVPKDLAEAKLKSGKKIRIYLGIDPTGSKLHLGHAVVLRKLQAFAAAGHEVIFLIGSFTAMIGDPSGRDVMREPLTMEDVKKNFETYKAQAAKVLDFSKITIKHNHEWLEKLKFEDILKLASNFTVQQMLQRDMFKKRVKDEQDISVVEFLYPLMVGYDSVVLDVDCELGGNDQLFNMLCGRTLQKAMGKKDKFVLTTKLIEGTDGRKMSKTYDNCIWLEDSAKDMFGKTMRIKDELITTYMECCTDISMKRIAEVEKGMKAGTNPKEYKVELAKAIVALYHDKKSADEAAEEFTRMFTDGGVPDEMDEVKAKAGESLLDFMVRAKLVTSKSDARRLIEQGAVKLEDSTVSDINAKVGKGILKAGKRKFVKVI